MSTSSTQCQSHHMKEKSLRRKRMELNRNQSSPSGEATVITTLDAHAAGEPLRIVTGGVPLLPGSTMLEKRRYMQQHLDYIRKTLMWEPRGHRDMYGAVLTQKVTPEADLGVLFMHNEGFSTMCGHGVIALVTSLIETDMIRAHGSKKTFRLDTPAGRVTAEGHVKGGRVESVSFENVPSFVLARNQYVDIDGVGCVKYDLAFGGAFYAYCDS